MTSAASSDRDERSSRASDRFLDPAPFPSPPPGFAIRAVLAARKVLLRAADALLPAEAVMTERALASAQTHGIAAAAKLGVSDVLEREGPLTGAELAARLGLHADSTHRFLRALATMGVYTLDAEGRFANNRYSRALRTGEASRTREWALYFSSGSNQAAWRGLERAVRTGESSFEHAHRMNVWDWFDAHPEEREDFAHAMMGLTLMDAPVLATLYPFTEVKVVCDVGGGRGTLLSELLVRHRHLCGVLCDAAGVLDSARSLLAARGVAKRVELRATDFFVEVPGGADAYVMKNILHDWDDERSRLILGNVRRVIPSDGRLILVEALCEKNVAEGFAPLSDLQMMLVCAGGRERSREDFDRLLRSAGFRLTRVFPYPTTSVLEAEPA